LKRAAFYHDFLKFRNPKSDDLGDKS